MGSLFCRTKMGFLIREQMLKKLILCNPFLFALANVYTRQCLQYHYFQANTDLRYGLFIYSLEKALAL